MSGQSRSHYTRVRSDPAVKKSNSKEKSTKSVVMYLLCSFIYQTNVSVYSATIENTFLQRSF